MPECTVYDTRRYYLPTVLTANGHTGGVHSSVLGQHTGRGEDRLWGRVAASRKTPTYVRRLTGGVSTDRLLTETGDLFLLEDGSYLLLDVLPVWVSVNRAAESDTTSGYEILVGGYEHLVTGRVLQALVDDGAMTAATACTAGAFDDDTGGTLIDIGV